MKYDCPVRHASATLCRHHGLPLEWKAVVVVSRFKKSWILLWCSLSPVLFIIFIVRISRCTHMVEGVELRGLGIVALLCAANIPLLLSVKSALQLTL